TFKKIEFTDEEYAGELQRIEQALVPLLEVCREHGTALRIGVNHGSLSDRIMSRYGDTPAGMVESAMEFLRVCVAHDFTQVVISIKASNVLVMTETVRRLVEAMDREGMHFPLHLGVTEAGDAEDGRVKSAVGIGSLLLDGIGDTIRVSLSEDPECEIPVARAILDHVDEVARVAAGYEVKPIEPAPSRRLSAWSGSTIRVVGVDEIAGKPVEITVGGVADFDTPLSLVPRDENAAVKLTAAGADRALRLKAFIDEMDRRGM
ncbi:MAG: flavodoxin-dependent (E)-4-hydroxy-3-methylbut-2-enyl-diphosphate synthase, partial [Duncaniella sp.]|nr:flavodoxin-dependent (E)-4-hydroxy-3-methylbut-2-enyl-diphosphate synthase [Duncaniella sp.]